MSEEIKDLLSDSFGAAPDTPLLSDTLAPPAPPPATTPPAAATATTTATATATATSPPQYQPEPGLEPTPPSTVENIQGGLEIEQEGGIQKEKPPSKDRFGSRLFGGLAGLRNRGDSSGVSKASVEGSVDTPPPPRTDIEAPTTRFTGYFSSSGADGGDQKNGKNGNGNGNGKKGKDADNDGNNKASKKKAASSDRASYARAHFIQLARNPYCRLGFCLLMGLLALLVILIPVLDSASVGPAMVITTRSGSAGEVLSAQMMPHPAYTGPLFPFGKITLRFDDDRRFLVVFRMDGLEETCTGCNYAIIDGTTCVDAGELGSVEHYDRDPRMPFQGSPYAMTSYDSQNGASHSTQGFFTGLTATQHEGKAMVVYGSEGAPIACGILERKTGLVFSQRLFAEIQPLPGATPGTNATGMAIMQFFEDETFLMSFEVFGLESKCFACGVFVQEGAACDETTPRAAYWNPDQVPTLPWKLPNGVFYHSSLLGFTNHAFFLYNGYSFAQNKHNSVVILGSQGQALGCGELTTHHAHYPLPATAKTTTGQLIGGKGSFFFHRKRL